LEDAYVQVLDVVVQTAAGERKHTVRPHEGDQLVNEDDGGFPIHYGEREVFVGGKARKLPGPKITLYGDKLIEVSRELRYEPRVRPSAQYLRDREVAEAERLARQLGTKPSA